MAKIKKQFLLEIEVDEEQVVEKYPNYRFNYDNPAHFISVQANNIKFVADTDMSKQGMKQWGYSIKVKEL